jgi:hypothetical protein
VLNIGEGRPLRGCSICALIDDHPRHSISKTVASRLLVVDPAVIDITKASAPAGEVERIVAELIGVRGTYRHIDCCRRVGCPDGSCDKVPEDLRGADLLGYQRATRE